MIKPKVSIVHQFIIAAFDYFTEYVEAASFANLTEKQVACFVNNKIICRYGLPQSIIIDNAKNLNNDMINTLCV